MKRAAQIFAVLFAASNGFHVLVLAARRYLAHRDLQERVEVDLCWWSFEESS